MAIYLQPVSLKPPVFAGNIGSKVSLAASPDEDQGGLGDTLIPLEALQAYYLPPEIDLPDSLSLSSKINAQGGYDYHEDDDNKDEMVGVLTEKTLLKLHEELKKLYSKKDVSYGDFFEVVNNALLRTLAIESNLKENASLGDIMEAGENAELLDSAQGLNFKEDEIVTISKVFHLSNDRDIKGSAKELKLKKGATFTDVYEKVNKKVLKELAKALKLKKDADYPDIYNALHKHAEEKRKNKPEQTEHVKKDVPMQPYVL